jgi:hypothetical protein
MVKSYFASSYVKAAVLKGRAIEKIDGSLGCYLGRCQDSSSWS